MHTAKTLETKKHLHELIDLVDDGELLELYLQLLIKHTITPSSIKASPGEIKAIKESLEAVAQFGTISHEDAIARLKGKFPNLSF